MKAKPKLIRGLSLGLVLLMLLASAVACKNDNEDPSGDSQSADQTESQSTNDVVETTPDTAGTDEKTNYAPEATRYDRTVTIAAEARDIRWINQFVAEEADTTDSVEYALYARQMLMKENHGVELVLNEEGSKLYTNFNTAYGAGQAYADMVFLKATDNMAAAQNGALCNLLAMPELNLDASYWDQRIQEEYRIGNRLFALEGDITTVDEMIAMVVLYNDNVYDESGYYEKYGTPYEMVANKEWTFENMLLMARPIAADDDGTTGMTEDDTWGIVSEVNAPYYMFIGSGRKVTSNTNGTLKSIATDESARATLINILQDVMKLATENSKFVIADRDWTGDVWSTASDVFAEDRALFRHTSLSAAYRLNNMEGKFGLLPVPMYDDTQDGYYCWMNATEQYPLAIPSTVADKSEVAEIAEAYAYYSRYAKNSFYSAFFDKMAAQKFCQSADDIAMLQLIMESKTYDIDSAMSSSDYKAVRALVASLVKGNKTGNLSSELGSKFDTMDTAIMNLVLNVNKNAKD